VSFGSLLYGSDTVFQYWILWVYALIGVIPACLIPFYGSTYKAFLLCFFPLHLIGFYAFRFYLALAEDVYDSTAASLKTLLSGFPWITFISLKDIFGRDD
jgi:hypothetical protein